MLLTEITIKNFRGIEDLSLSLDDFCVLIGENNIGKSSILDAVQICLTRSFTRQGVVFEEYDYHLEDLSAEPSKSKPIEITLKFTEAEENEWPQEVSQLLSDAVQIDDNSISSISFRVTSYFDQAINDFVTDYDFINLSGEPLHKAKSNLPGLRRLVPAYYLASLRDAAQEFRARSPFWRPFVHAPEIDDETRVKLEEELSDLNEKVIEKHTAFDDVKEYLKKVSELMPLGSTEPVSIEAIPSKVFDILSRTRVHFTSKTGARIPITRHGSGTQSLAVICLFDAFLQKQEKEYIKPLLALEEPEAHLHPSAIKAVGKMLEGFSGQKLISTHSGDLLAGISLQKIRRLRRKNGKISVYKIEKDILEKDEINKIDYQIRATRGSLLFSRCWLLVEGETEALLLPECARAMGCDLYANGVSCLEFSQVGIEKYIKIADHLGIEWFALADNDKAGESFRNSALGQLGAREEKEHIRLLEHGTMEVFLCMEGFGEIYEKNISNQKSDNITEDSNTLKYWQQVAKSQGDTPKPKIALAIAEKMNADGEESVPKLLKEVIEQSLKLARMAG